MIILGVPISFEGFYAKKKKNTFILERDVKLYLI